MLGFRFDFTCWILDVWYNRKFKHSWHNKGKVNFLCILIFMWTIWAISLVDFLAHRLDFSQIYSYKKQYKWISEYIHIKKRYEWIFKYIRVKKLYKLISEYVRMKNDTHMIRTNIRMGKYFNIRILVTPWFQYLNNISAFCCNNTLRWMSMTCLLKLTGLTKGELWFESN